MESLDPKILGGYLQNTADIDVTRTESLIYVQVSYSIRESASTFRN